MAKGAVNLPKDHRPFMVDVAGGFSCANCKYLRPEHTCSSADFQRWNGGSNKLPKGNLHQMCSDWFEPRSERKTLSDQVRDQRAKK
jgi:hypothetical protein